MVLTSKQTSTMSDFIADGEPSFKDQDLIGNDLQSHEFLLSSLLPNSDALYSDDDINWAFNDPQIYTNNPNKTAYAQQLQRDKENEKNISISINGTIINTNAITSDILLANDVLTLSPKHEIDPQTIYLNPHDAQEFADTIYQCESQNLYCDINEQIELVSAHKCKLCGQLCEHYYDIIKHIEMVHGALTIQSDSENFKSNDKEDETATKNLYLCGKCHSKSIAYESIEQLKQHMINSHNLANRDSNQTANSSNDDLLDEELLKKMIHNQEVANKRVKCMIKGCDNSFASREVMLDHITYHTEGMKKKFKCPVCDKLFFIWRTCRAHIWKMHKTDVGLYECTMCNTFKCLAPYDLLVHMKIHSNPKNFKPFLCSTCGVQFNRLAELQNHSKTHLVTKSWDVNCPKCDKPFANNKYLKRHIQSVHDKYKPFVCNICGHKCARKSMLDLHLRQHTGEKPYKCELCDFKTGDHNSFRRHSLRHSGLTQYKCQYCDYTTIQSNPLKIHMKKKHPGKEGIFSCQTCSYNTVSEKLYKQHIEKHISDKPSENETNQMDQTVNLTVPNAEDEETQIGLFPDHPEDTVDTGGITIPAIETN